MRNTLAAFLVLAAAAGSSLPRPLAAAGGISGNLASVGWLHDNLPDVLVLDASPAQLYKAGHIPGAVSVDLMSWYGIQELPRADMERLYQTWGVSPGKKVVMYDQGGTFLATRLFFQLYYDSFPVGNLLVLDGGLSKWQESGFAVTQEATPRPQHGSFTITHVNEDIRVRLPEFLTASGDPVHNALVEGLGPDWHFGEVAPFDKAGHPPNGILLPSADFFNDDKTFKSPDEITRMLTYLGITRDQQVHSYCGGGVAASVPFFAIKFIAGYPSVKLFKESEMGWLADERGLPFWTYDAPLLLREGKWLQFWAGERIRTFGGGQVSVVDVRPAAAFAEGHVSVAVNIPADVFRKLLGAPEKLADVLGVGGVDAAYEAVVVSGGGLTPDAALAFAALDRLGQNKTSIFVDAPSAWPQSGLAVKKEARPAKPVAYAGSSRNVIIADPGSTRGAYPKIFLASGRMLPSKAPEGTMVHVPYTDLLTADGRPKAAKDIWNTLTKAGVPRYAEIICVSDDPGEAAVNYVVLKLMGYPDIKILAS